MRSCEIDWDEYNQFEKIEIDRIINGVQRCFEQKLFIKRSLAFWYNHLYYNLSFLVFKKYLRDKELYKVEPTNSHVKRFFSFKKSNIEESTFSLISRLSSNNGKIVVWEFFHRHDIYKEQFEKKINAVFMDRITGHVVEWDKKTFRLIRSILGKGYCDDLILENLYLPTLLNSKIHKAFENLTTAKVLLTNSHAIYSSPVSMFYLSYSKLLGTRIIINQAGLILPYLKTQNQYQFEFNIADKYLSWGNYNHTEKNIEFGSYYMIRAKNDFEQSDKTLVVLPQLPSFIRPFSTYFINSGKDTLIDIENLLASIKRNLKKFEGKIDLRCKSSCREDYQKLLLKYGMDDLLVSDDINKNQKGYGRYKCIITTYYSTSITESFYKSSSIYFVISKEMGCVSENFEKDFRELPNTFSNFDEFDYTNYNNDPVREFVLKYAKQISPEDSATELVKMIEGFQ